MLRLVLAVLALGTVFVVPMPASSETPLERGIQLFDQGKLAEAKTTLTPLASANPPNVRAAFYLGRIAMRADDAKEAERWFETIVKLEPTSSEYHLWLGRAYGQRARQSSKLTQMGWAKKTKAEFERATELDPDNLEARSALIDYFLQAPGFLGGGVDKARDQAEEIRKRDPYRGMLADARIAEDQKDVAAAERAYLEAVRSRPDSLSGRYTLANFYARTDRHDRAFETFDGILSDKPGDLIALYGIGRTGAVSGHRLDRAEVALKEYLAAPQPENGPSAAAAHWRLGMVYEKGGRKDEARREYQQSLALDPDFGEAKKSLAKLKD